VTNRELVVEDPAILPALRKEKQIKLRLNGADHTLMIEPRMSLLDALREYLGLTGTKKGCNQGACGACSALAFD
jgi:xanthine dehydrogenase YagT iron-sulfur-binding subunit